MRRCLLFVVLLLPITSAQAFDTKGLQPLSPFGVFSTFSTESLKQNQLGFGLGLEKSIGPDFYRTTAQFAYGIHDRVELDLTVPYVIQWEHKEDGLEDVSLGIRHRVIDEGKFTPSLAYLLMVSAPTGREEFTTNGNVGAGLLLSKKVGPLRAHLNLVFLKPGKDELKNEYMMNAGAELAITHNYTILAELVGRKDYFKKKLNLLEWRVGYRIATTESIYTTLGAGFDVKNRTPDYRLMLSVSFILPQAKQKIQKVYEP